MKRLLILFLLISTVSAADFNVSWTPIKEDIVNKEYIITIQNLDTDMRTVDVDSFFEDTNFDTSKIRDVEFYEQSSKDKMILDKKQSKTLKINKKMKEVSHGKITLPSVKTKGKINNAGTKTFILKFKTPPDGSHGKVGLKINGKEYHPYWNSTWSNRKKITLTGNISGSQTDYQLLLNVTYEPEMNPDFSDVRFCNDTDQLSTWLESKVNESYALIWVKFPHTPANGETENYWMYYGNSEAEENWNINNTFIREIDGLVGSWHLDEGSGTIAYDSSGKDNDGTLTNMNESTCWVNGKFGKALTFDGTDDAVDCGTDASLTGIDSEISLEAWIYLDSLITHNKVIYHSNDCYGMAVLSDGRTEVRIRDGGTNYDANAPAGSVTSGAWYHLIGIYDGEYVKSYVNNVMKNEKAHTGDIDTNNAVIYISNPSSYPFHGIIDEIRIYNISLISDEISDIYNNYGYTTTNYPNHVLVCQKVSNPPTYTFGDTGYYVDSIYFNSSNPYYNLIDYKGDIAVNHSYYPSDDLEWTAAAKDDDTGLVVTSMGSSEIDFTTYESVLDWLQLVNLDDSKIYTLQNGSGNLEEHQASENAVNFTTDLSPDNYEIEITDAVSPTPTPTPEPSATTLHDIKLSDKDIKSFYYPFMYILFIVIIIGGFMHVFGI